MKILKSAVSLSLSFLLGSCQAFASFNSQNGLHSMTRGKFLLTKASFGSLFDPLMPKDTWNKYENAQVLTVYSKRNYVEVCFYNEREINGEKIRKITVKSVLVDDKGYENVVGLKVYENEVENNIFGLDYLYKYKEYFLDKEDLITPKMLWSELHDFESYSV